MVQLVGFMVYQQKLQNIVEGLGSADSITVNPQKLLGIAKTSSLLLGS